MKYAPNADFLIFDLGNVIIDIYYPKTLAYIKQQVHPKLHGKVEAFYITDFHLDYEKGLITSAQFRDEVRAYFEMDWSDQFVDELWNSLLGKIPKNRIELIKKLSDSYQVGVLSNTNEIHINAVNLILKEDHSLKSLEDIFGHVFLSHEMNLSKPDPAIYLSMVDQLRTSPERVVFFDDLEANVASANKVGIQAIHVTNPQIIFDFFAHV